MKKIILYCDICGNVIKTLKHNSIKIYNNMNSELPFHPDSITDYNEVCKICTDDLCEYIKKQQHKYNI